MKNELIPKSTLAKVLRTKERNPLVEIVQQVTKLKAINRTYNDSSFGGANNGAYVALRAVRRF